MAIISISIVPIGTNSTSLSKYVASTIKILKSEKDIKYQLTSMGTIIEGKSIDKLLEICKKMHESTYSQPVKRVLTTIKIDDRRDKKASMEDKIKSIKEKL
jgi:uncharacterized protein (TIGR00106 family)